MNSRATAYRTMTGETSNSTLSVLGNAKSTPACWSCGDMRAAHFCTACGKVQPPAPADYFSFFGLPRKLNIDIANLERSFYQMSRKLHPDTYARATEKEQQWSLEQTAQLNDAYRTLKDPIGRTQYLLQLEGVELEEQSKSATEKARSTGEIKKQFMPPDLLEEVFELNMQVEELRMNKKAGEEDPSLVDEILGQKLNLETKFEGLSRELTSYWNEWDSAAESGANEDRLRSQERLVDLLNRRTYIRNLVKDVNEVLETYD